jgi:NADPH:quinone reductase-like Zn-dependent oxidoreductase
MRAAIYTEYGTPEVLRLAEVAKPIPKANEILIKIHATPVNFGDLTARNFKKISPSKFTMPFPLWILMKIFFGISKPRKQILGNEFAGVVEFAGKSVIRFKPGDEVFGYCGSNFGANAEYLCMNEDGLIALKPYNLPHEEASTLPYGSLMALNLLRKAKLKRGQKILINGASGSIGFAAVQLAKHYFGADVTGVCSTPRIDMVKNAGALEVIDYTRQDFTENGKLYDVIFDVLGKSSFSRCKSSLNPAGRYLLVSFKVKQLFQMLFQSRKESQKIICSLSNEKTKDLILIKELAERKLVKSFIDKRFPLEQIAEAHSYMEDGQRKGSVVVTLAA